MRSFTVALVVAAFASGCIVVNNNPDHHSGAGGNAPVGVTTYQIASGLPTSISPGVQAGYGITANTGGSYRLVWTGDSSASGSYREFWGSIWSTGTFTSVTPGCVDNSCPLESNDYVSDPIATNDGERIDFDTFATDGIDGLDFVTSTEPIYIDCYIDGVHYPDLVFFPSAPDGGAISSVATIPFGLTQ